MKYKKRELLSMVDSMQKACNIIYKRNNIPKENLIDILTECQAVAIEVGNYIESAFEGKEFIVKLLEDYVETVYQISLCHDTPIEYSKNIKVMWQQLMEIYNKINLGIPEDKKEVVFLPYKAAMWDSLESIWMAADKRDDVDAYVIPIPYFDKNEDGSFGAMHYEGEEYPEYVPITKWDEYDLTTRRPDAIYFHNPYDDMNHVTSVHPDYYSNELQKHTNMLVYVPYFVAVNDTICEELCLNPGVLFANKVIVQSEIVRKVYIEQFHKFEKENSCEGVFGVAEDKFLALGSPKYDKILNSNKNDFDLPMDWKAKIYKEDNTARKIILYNTTIDAMLNQKGMVEKIEQVLEIFEKQDEVLLWWRPHPLLQATLQAMKPIDYEKYMRLVNDFMEKQIGIYDDTADLQRAIVYADAYYGDNSSVVELFKQTGKPILLQRVANE